MSGNMWWEAFLRGAPPTWTTTGSGPLGSVNVMSLPGHQFISPLSHFNFNNFQVMMAPPLQQSHQTSEETEKHKTKSTTETEVNNAAKLKKDPKTHACQSCDRTFSHGHVLRNHLITHSGEKPYECPTCHRKFSRPHHLKVHERQHSGETPYHCQHNGCGKKFKQMVHLRKHMRVHGIEFSSMQIIPIQDQPLDLSVRRK